MAKNHGPSVKDDRQYEALRQQGTSKEKAARIANSDSSSTGRKGGKAGKYEDWSKDDLQKKAADVIGLGARDEQFGWKQIVGLIIGFAAVDLGAVTVWIGIRRRRKNKRS